ncbi:hypothetical protein NL676_024937 [Syzygium grande]|nr:hypothetical protein NL676_024937 [Syzygium grande]
MELSHDARCLFRAAKSRRYDGGGFGKSWQRQPTRVATAALATAFASRIGISLLPTLGHILKKALPANGKITEDVKETVQERTSEFH